MRVLSKQGLAGFALCLLGSTAAHAELPLVGIIAQGRAVIDLRARYETVTDNSKAFDANAGTVRARLADGARLAVLDQLTAGDFAAVKRQVEILGEAFAPDEFLSQLESEHRAKPEVRQRRGIGFVKA